MPDGVKEHGLKGAEDGDEGQVIGERARARARAGETDTEADAGARTENIGEGESLGRSITPFSAIASRDGLTLQGPYS